MFPSWLVPRGRASRTRHRTPLSVSRLPRPLGHRDRRWRLRRLLVGCPSRKRGSSVPVDSSGLLLHRTGPDGSLEILIAHMGGPFWAQKNEHAWSIPKGIHDEGEDDHLAVAEREFAEEMGSPAPVGPSLDLGTIRSGKKRVRVFAREGDFDAAVAVSNTFQMEWPRGSGVMANFPEMDRAEWVSISAAETLLVKGQLPFLERLRASLRR